MKKLKIKKRWLILTIINILLFMAYIILTVISGNTANSLPDQKAVKNWSPDSSQYSQTSCFISESYDFNINSVYQMRSSVDTALEQASIKLDEDNKNARLWIDAYSAEHTVSVSSDNIKAPIEVTATFCGGDFFYFHKFDYKSGYCFSEDDLNNDRAVIDENLAWQLYGSSDVEGLEFKINNVTFIIAGVAECSDDKVSELTYGSKNRIYIPYSAFEKISSDSNISSDNDEAVKTAMSSSLPITCYETIMPSPVSKFGYKIIQEQFPENLSEAIIVENSSRFSTHSLFSVMKKYGTRSVITNDIIYPYWENSARVIEDKLVLMLFFRIPLLILPVIYLVIVLIALWKRYGIHFKDCKVFIDKMIDRRRKRIYYKDIKKEGDLNEKQ